MARPRNVEAKYTSIKVPWALKDRMLKFQQIKSEEPGKNPRKERDEETFERILFYYELKHK